MTQILKQLAAEAIENGFPVNRLATEGAAVANDFKHLSKPDPNIPRRGRRKASR